MQLDEEVFKQLWLDGKENFLDEFGFDNLSLSACLPSSLCLSRHLMTLLSCKQTVEIKSDLQSTHLKALTKQLRMWVLSYSLDGIQIGPNTPSGSRWLNEQQQQGNTVAHHE